MKLAYIGSGYVGQVNATGSAYYAHDVILVDILPEVVASLNAGKPTIFERDLDQLMRSLVIDQKRLRATVNLEEAIAFADVSFICVGTPDLKGQIDLKFIRNVASQIGQFLRTKKEYHVVVVKSTVVPGTTLDVVKPILESHSGKICGIDFGIAMNPEFLREGVALNDCLQPNSIVIGVEDDRTKSILAQVYHWASLTAITFCGITAAEAIKYAKNSFLAMKITFANEWANYCQRIGIDVKQVMDAIGKDPRIGSSFLRNGPGYGGSCFPKDVNAIITAAKSIGSPLKILEEVVDVNNHQYMQLIQLGEKKLGTLNGKKVAILGLSFKPDTDDTRESPALKIIEYLVTNRCLVKAFCPQGIPMAQKMLESKKIQIAYCSSPEECIKGVDIVFIPTDWPEFREILSQIEVPIIIGHRSFVNPAQYPNVYSLGYPK